MESSFLGITSSGWVAIAAFVYAGATFALAFFTNKASIRSVDAAASHTRDQVDAAKQAARIQATATSISNNRQAWINAVRDEIAGFLSDMDHRYSMLQTLEPSHETDRQKLEIERQIRLRLYKIQLLINPNEGESTELLNMLENAAGQFLIQKEDREKLVSHAQGMFKTEWERVKKGE